MCVYVMCGHTAIPQYLLVATQAIGMYTIGFLHMNDVAREP